MSKVIRHLVIKLMHTTWRRSFIKTY